MMRRTVDERARAERAAQQYLDAIDDVRRVMVRDYTPTVTFTPPTTEIDPGVAMALLRVAEAAARISAEHPRPRGIHAELRARLEAFIDAMTMFEVGRVYVE